MKEPLQWTYLWDLLHKKSKGKWPLEAREKIRDGSGSLRTSFFLDMYRNTDAKWVSVGSIWLSWGFFLISLIITTQLDISPFLYLMLFFLVSSVSHRAF